MSNTSRETEIVEWDKLNWKQIHKSIYKLQKRIYRFVN